MDNETIRCQRFVRAIILQSIKDTVMPMGFQNNVKACREAYNFLFNEHCPEYQDFCDWCDLADFDSKYWQSLALMNLAYELNFNPWLRNRIRRFLRGVKHWKRLKDYYCHCCEKEYRDFIGAIENA